MTTRALRFRLPQSVLRIVDARIHVGPPGVGHSVDGANRARAVRRMAAVIIAAQLSCLGTHKG